MELRIKKLYPTAFIPTRAKPGDSGLDLYACLDSVLNINPGQYRKVGTGIAIELPEPAERVVPCGAGRFAWTGLEAQVRGRSSFAAKGIIACGGIGTVDNGYRGEIGVVLLNLSSSVLTVVHGDRIAQLVVSPVVYPSVVVVDQLDQTERGEAGFGSTGV
jgi:dUTP pyrophosphatase